MHIQLGRVDQQVLASCTGGARALAPSGGQSAPLPPWPLAAPPGAVRQA